MLVLSHRPVDRLTPPAPPGRRRRSPPLAWLGMAVRAETPSGRRPGEPLTTQMSILLPTLPRSEVAQALSPTTWIPAGPPRHGGLAWLSINAWSTSRRSSTDGCTHAVIRMDGESGELRSVVRLTGRVKPTIRASTDRRPRPRPVGRPAWRTDRALTRRASAGTRPADAWRVTGCAIDGYLATGDGLIVWVHRGGQLAALSGRDPTWPRPTRWSGPSGDEAARIAGGAPGPPRDPSAAAAESWSGSAQRFPDSGGADDTDVLLRLAYRIDPTVPVPEGEAHHIAIFVDAGSGAPIAGWRPPDGRHLPDGIARRSAVTCRSSVELACLSASPSPSAVRQPATRADRRVRASRAHGITAATFGLELRPPLASATAGPLRRSARPDPRPTTPDGHVGDDLVGDRAWSPIAACRSWCPSRTSSSARPRRTARSPPRPPRRR